jgi:hypothetical protein
VFANRVLRRIFWPEREKVTGGLRNSHPEELHNLYSSPQCYWDYHIKENAMGETGNTP